MIRYITIHCAATPNGKPFNIVDIDSWHKERGFLRRPEWLARQSPELKHVGYHSVILLTGEIQLGRHPFETGAHVAGHNIDNYGICMIGTDKFTPAQWDALTLHVADLMEAYPTIVSVMGHRDWPNVKKECPGFDAGRWFVNQHPDAKNILGGH